MPVIFEKNKNEYFWIFILAYFSDCEYDFVPATEPTCSKFLFWIYENFSELYSGIHTRGNIWFSKYKGEGNQTWTWQFIFYHILNTNLAKKIFERKIFDRPCWILILDNFSTDLPIGKIKFSWKNLQNSAIFLRGKF